MQKSYIAIERGIVEETLYYLQDRLTIGRAPENDIIVGDPDVAELQAIVYHASGGVVIESLEGTRGVLLNGEPVVKAVLNNGDRLEIGNTRCHFFQEEVTLPEKDPLDPRHGAASPPPGEAHMIEGRSLTRSSRRLMEVIPSLPLFEGVSAEGLQEIIDGVRLLIYEPDQMIVNQDDVGKSLFIILDGKVKVFWLDPRQSKVPLAVLEEGDFFGEMAFFTGAPRSACLQALDNTLLCEINYNDLRWVVYRWPAIKHILLRYYRERVASTEAKKKASGYTERRKYPRANMTLPMSFTVSGNSEREMPFKGKVYRTLTKNMSASGLLIRARDAALKNIPLGSQLAVEIVLPSPWPSLRCPATLKNVQANTEKQRTYVYLGAEFAGLTPERQDCLKRFLYPRYSDA